MNELSSSSALQSQELNSRYFFFIYLSLLPHPHPPPSFFVFLLYRLVGLVVKASATRAVDPGFESRLRHNFSWSSHTSDLKAGTPVATMPGVWRYRVSAGNGRPGVSIVTM